MTLADYQQDSSRRMANFFKRSGCVVVSGRTGIGKRVVAKAASSELGLELIPVVFNAPSRAVCKALLGHDDLSDPECSEGGLLNREGVCIYLSGVESADPDLLPLFRELLRRHFLRGLASEPLGPVIVVGLRTDTPTPAVRETDSVVMMLPNVRLPDVIAAADLLTIAKSIASDIGVDEHLELEHFENMRLPREGLGSLRKWLVEASVLQGGITPGNFLEAMYADIVPFVERINYRGTLIKKEEYFRWASQFEIQVRPVVDHLIRIMVERDYVMSLFEFNRTINDVVQRSGIPRGSNIVICEWQRFGKSGPIMAHKVKERGNWRFSPINLDDAPEAWVEAVAGRAITAVLADDFVGTGNAIVEAEPRIRLLLDSCETISLRILIVAGFTDGIQRVRHLEQEYNDRVKIIVGRLLSSADTCFCTGSNILEPGERHILEEFCERFGGLVKTRIPKGYGDMGALFVFPDSIPNNTLPIFWYDGKPDRWQPLLPASMVV